jgi:hypothetical protein
VQAAIKPIETRYMGYRFRSRLEARWAVFFQTLGVQWEYEPEGFDLGDGYYLPDFRVQCGEVTHWYEVKPGHIKSSDKFSKFTRLVTRSYDSDTGSFFSSWTVETHLVSGDPLTNFASHLNGSAFCPRCTSCVEPDYRFRNEEVGFNCEDCDWVTESGGDNPWEVGFAGIAFKPHKGWILSKQQHYERLLCSLERAGVAARTARFEHGEVP